MKIKSFTNQGITDRKKEKAIRMRGLILSVSVDLEIAANEILRALVVPKDVPNSLNSEMLLEAFILRHLPLRKKMELIKEGLTAIGLFDEVKEVFNELTQNFIPTRNKAAHSMSWYGHDQIGFGGFEFEKESGSIFIKQAKLSMDDWEIFCSSFMERIGQFREIVGKTRSVVIKNEN